MHYVRRLQEGNQRTCLRDGCILACDSYIFPDYHVNHGQSRDTLMSKVVEAPKSTFLDLPSTDFALSPLQNGVNQGCM